MCENVEKVMEMFSKELQLLDQNTVQYMIDEMQDTIDEQSNTIDKQLDKINTLKNTLKQEKLQHEKALQDALKRIEELEKIKQ